METFALNPAADDPVIYGAGTSESAWQAWLGLSSIKTLTIHQLAETRRVIIVAPHPDDEVLGCGGLMALLSQQGYQIVLVAITDGEASHPGSSLWHPQKLKQSRAAETADALEKLLVVNVQIVRAGFDDGSLTREYPRLVDFLMLHVRPNDLLIGTWRHDGHPDHEAVGSACAAVAKEMHAKLLEAPIWAWHWGTPGDSRIPWRHAVKIMLPPAIVEAKREAINCFNSQLSMDASTGSSPILPPHVVARFHRPSELFFLGL